MTFLQLTYLCPFTPKARGENHDLLMRPMLIMFQVQCVSAQGQGRGVAGGFGAQGPIGQRCSLVFLLGFFKQCHLFLTAVGANKSSTAWKASVIELKVEAMQKRGKNCFSHFTQRNILFFVLFKLHSSYQLTLFDIHVSWHWLHPCIYIIPPQKHVWHLEMWTKPLNSEGLQLCVSWWRQRKIVK